MGKIGKGVPLKKSSSLSKKRGEETGGQEKEGGTCHRLQERGRGVFVPENSSPAIRQNGKELPILKELYQKKREIKVWKGESVALEECWVKLDRTINKEKEVYSNITGGENIGKEEYALALQGRGGEGLNGRVFQGNRSLREETL